MTEKRFERIYGDVDVFCRDHNAKGISQLLEKEDYDTIVDLLNELTDENEQLKKELDKLKVVNEMLSMDFANSEHELYKENEQLKFELGKLNILYNAKCKTEEQLIEMGKEVEKENEQLKQELADIDSLIYDLGHDEMRRQYEEITKGDDVND